MQRTRRERDRGWVLLSPVTDITHRDHRPRPRGTIVRVGGLVLFQQKNDKHILYIYWQHSYWSCIKHFPKFSPSVVWCPAGGRTLRTALSKYLSGALDRERTILKHNLSGYKLPDIDIPIKAKMPELQTKPDSVAWQSWWWMLTSWVRPSARHQTLSDWPSWLCSATGKPELAGVRLVRVVGLLSSWYLSYCNPAQGGVLVRHSMIL